MNIAELAQEKSSKRAVFSEQATKELHICMDAVAEIARLTREALLNSDPQEACKVEPLEDVIDLLTRDLKARHVQRLQAGKCTLELGFIYNDCINNFERVADHCSNLAITVLEETGNQVHPHDYLLHLKDDNGSYQEQFNNWFEHYCGALEPIK